MEQAEATGDGSVPCAWCGELITAFWRYELRPKDPQYADLRGILCGSCTIKVCQQLTAALWEKAGDQAVIRALRQARSQVREEEEPE